MAKNTTKSKSKFMYFITNLRKLNKIQENPNLRKLNKIQENPNLINLTFIKNYKKLYKINLEKS